MAILEIPRDPSPKTLAWFGGLLGLLLAVLAGLVTWRSGWGRGPQILLGVAAGVSAIYYALPSLRKPIYLGWVYALWPVGTVVSLVLLAVVYYGVLTPLGLLRRLLGRDPMQRRLDPAALTYWEPHRGPADAERYFKPY